MPEYTIEIIHPQLARRNFQAGFLHFLTGLLLLLVALGFSYRPQFLIPACGLLAFGLAYILLAIFLKRVTPRFPKLGLWARESAVSLFFLAAILDYSPNDLHGTVILLVLALAFLVIYLLEKRSSLPFRIQFNDKGVTVPTNMSNRLYPWKALNHVILHDGLLTLDLSGNKLIQFENAEEWDSEAETSFNEYCKSHIPGESLI